VKLVNKGNSCKDEYSSHYQRSQNTPEEYLVLVLRLYREVGENENENKNIVNTQGVFDYITCKEFQRFGLAKLKKDKYVESQGKQNPNRTPDKGLFERNFVGIFIKNTKIKRKYRENKNMKPDPEKSVYLHLFKIICKSKKIISS